MKSPLYSRAIFLAPALAGSAARYVEKWYGEKTVAFFFMEALSPFPNTIVAVMVDGVAKYMMDAASYDHFTNEARGSQFARGVADVAVKGIEDLPKQLKKSLPMQ